ncbi:MAG: hypothetical protein M1818_001253 [Claussenomyces sp. TS43310]|nr:MAG: hypothetical protein M1818_001253 [Claussenomyces sp. TS43310]
MNHMNDAMVRELRKGKHENGLILANGGVLTYQHAICLSSQPRRNGTAYPTQNPLPPLLTDISSPPIDTHADGEANIETYTVEFNRDGTPLRGHIIGRLTKNSHRFVANASDRHTLEQLSSTSTEQIGKRGWVKRGDRGRNLFTLDQSAKL